MNELWASDEPPSRGDNLLIASGKPGARQISGLPTDVPGRGSQRPNWKRGRFCAVVLLRHLFKSHQHLFPLAVERIDSPDFVFAPPQPALSIAVEVTDAGEPEHQDWMDRSAASPGVFSHVPDPPEAASQGNPYEQAFVAALDQAVVRKLDAKFWRHAADLPRWLLLYDNSLTRADVSDVDAEACLCELAQRRQKDGLHALVLVRAAEVVMIAECG